MRLRSATLSVFAFSIALAAPAAGAQEDCDGPLNASRAMSDTVTEAFTAISDKDAAAQAKVLPKLKALMNTLPATEIKPQVCTGKNINTYTQMQYVDLSVMRDHGVNIGFPSDLPIVKQPQLNQGNLPYATGWIQYEQGDFTGALATFEKGLKIFPQNLEIQNEYLATLIQLQRNTDAAAAATKFIENTYTMTDAARSKMYQALAIAQFGLGDKAAATQSAQVSVYYDNTDSARSTQKLITDSAN